MHTYARSPKPAAVIFDMDGVIVDSMPYHFLAWYETLRGWGIRVSCFDVYTKEGERWDKSLKDFLIRARVRPTPAVLRTIFNRRQRIFKKYFKRFIFKGSAQLLACLKKRRYKLALVTGTPLSEVRKILPAHTRNYFDCIVAGDDVKQGKPHPEPYLKAGALLQLSPRECVVVENAPFGIESAKRAGMFCVAVTTSLPAAYLKRADRIVDSLEAIPAVIAGVCSTGGAAGRRKKERR
ncbi:MAG TPA: HAD family phosphatase [Candidatus Omnitrophota bacterium]|nr:HAD family phosphatase [Candidatus Omnitrophota bacterium]HRZ14605.1 HAD family phosphatase [Candidatus Omnitrophota bacterium]